MSPRTTWFWAEVPARYVELMNINRDTEEKSSSMNKYKIGTELLCNEVKGVVVPNRKLPGDICVERETGQFSSYDGEWLDKNTIIIDRKKKL